MRITQMEMRLLCSYHLLITNYAVTYLRLDFIVTKYFELKKLMRIFQQVALHKKST